MGRMDGINYMPARGSEKTRRSSGTERRHWHQTAQDRMKEVAAPKAHAERHKTFIFIPLAGAISLPYARHQLCAASSRFPRGFNDKVAGAGETLRNRKNC